MTGGLDLFINLACTHCDRHTLHKWFKKLLLLFSCTKTVCRDLQRDDVAICDGQF